MARFPEPVRHPPNPTVGVGMQFPPIPTTTTPARLIRPGGGDDEYGHNMSLAALMARQKEIAEQQAGIGQMPMGTIPQGLAGLAQSFVAGLQRRRAEKALEAGQGEIASALSGGLNQDTGEVSPEAMATLWRRDPDMAMDLYKSAIALKAQKAKQENWVDIPTPAGETGQWQTNTVTGEKMRRGAAPGVTVNTGTDKLTDWLAKDTVFYPGARNAGLELEQENLDAELASAAGAGGSAIPGVGGYLTSEKYKRAETAARSWIYNVLRKESGAVIGEEELAGNMKTYFPQPGDGPEQVAYKRRLREERVNAMRYGLESGAPETLKKIDEDYERRKKQLADAAAAAAAKPAPDATTPPPDATPPPPVEIEPLPPAPRGSEDWWPTPEEWKNYTPASRKRILELVTPGAQP